MKESTARTIMYLSLGSTISALALAVTVAILRGFFQ